MTSASTSRTTRRVAAVAMAALTLAATATAATAAVPPPSPDATPVTVRAGQTTPVIDVTLHPLASFGTVTGSVVDAGTSTVPDGETVFLVTPGGTRVNHQVIETDVNPNGTFQLTAPPSATGYALCFLQEGQSRAPRAPYSQCLGSGSTWSGKAPRAAARFVGLSAGQTVRLGKIELKPGARISGVVTTTDGRTLQVAAFAVSIDHPDERRVSLTGHHPEKHFVIDELPPSPKGWIVCVDGQKAYPADGTGSVAGYVGECGGDAWEGGPVPTDVKPVDVAAGGTVVLPRTVLRDAGSIEGTVVARGSGRVLHNTYVSVFDADGHEVTQGYARGRHGVYKANGLSGGSYYVCASARSGINGGHSYFGSCLDGQEWAAGQPPNGSLVSVTRGDQTPDVQVALSRAATIKGRITRADGKAAKYGRVYLYDPNGKQVEVRETDDRGFYSLLWLHPAPGDGYLICADEGAVSRTAPQSAPGCYDGAAWEGPPTPVPNSAQPVQVQAAQTTSGIDITLPAGGAISGKLTSADGKHRRFYSHLILFDQNGTQLQRVFASGTYTLEGVPAGQGYRVCVESTAVRENAAAPGGKYPGRCYANASWSG